MGRSVLLRHELADGSSHFDWLIEREEGGRLITFRVATRIDEGAHQWAATRIADHRALYLDYEGEITGGRGRVARVASGSCRVLEEGSGHLRLTLDLGRASGIAEGRREAGDMWQFSVE